MVISSDKKRRYLRWVSIKANAEQTALRNAIEDQLFSRGNASSSGQRIAGISANGASTTLQADNAETMMEVWSQLMDLYDVCSSSLGSSDQADILTEMLYRLDTTPVTSYINDFTGIQH